MTETDHNTSAESAESVEDVLREMRDRMYRGYWTRARDWANRIDAAIARERANSSESPKGSFSGQGDAKAWMHPDGRVISADEKAKMLTGGEEHFVKVAARFNIALSVMQAPAAIEGDVEALSQRLCDYAEADDLFPQERADLYEAARRLTSAQPAAVKDSLTTQQAADAKDAAASEQRCETGLATCGPAVVMTASGRHYCSKCDGVANGFWRNSLPTSPQEQSNG